VSGRLRRLLPWLVGAAILIALLARVPFAALRGGLVHGPWALLVAYTVPFIVATLIADAYATGVCLRIAGEPRPFGTLTLVRGATYLLGLLNYALGQGGIGLYLHRTGVRPARGTGIVLFLLIVNFGALAAAAALGLALDQGPWAAGMRGLGVAILAAGLAYLALIALRPGFLAKREVLAPLFAAGPLGHLAALAGRMPHLLLLILGHWGAMGVWGIRVPAAEALARMPAVLLASVVPLSPSGLGTVQATQVLLFSPYSTAATQAGREAAVLAYSLAFSLLGLAVQAAVGAVCLATLRRRERNTSPRDAFVGAGLVPARNADGRGQGPPLHPDFPGVAENGRGSEGPTEPRP
jgi:hypothetical protein